MTFDIIVSFEQKTNACGLDNDLPWNYSPDLQLFKHITTYPHDKINILIVGYKTFIHLPSKFKPLNRRFVVIADTNRTYHIPSHFENYVLFVCDSFNKAYKYTQTIEYNDIFVMGGIEIYKQALSHPKCRFIYAGIFNLNRIVYDKIFPIDSINLLDKIEVIYPMENIVLDEFTYGTYEFSKYRLR
jgi:dihydrofolate reductase